MNNSVTVTLNKREQPFLFSNGMPIKIGGLKRWYMVVVEVDNSTEAVRLKATGKYRPSPKSQLRRKNYFSKNKYKLLLE